jgi:hypothetical protein
MVKSFFQRILAALLFTAALPAATAQYNILAYPPPPSFTHADLWHFTLSGPGDSSYTQYYVALRLLNASDVLLVKTNSSVFAWSTPALYINLANLSSISPLLTSYTSSQTYADVINSGGFFPPGNYQAHFTLYGRPSDGEFTELAEYGYPLQVDFFFPPYLLTVPNEDSICETNPVFSWTPAVSSSPVTVSYNFRMVEIQPFQTPLAAMGSNPLYHEEQSWPVTLMLYPATAQPLVYGNRYAWQVEALVNNEVMTQSEIWSFTYGCSDSETVDTLPLTDVFYKARKENDGGPAKLSGKYLNIHYTERYSPPEGTFLSYRLYTSGGQAAQYDAIDLPLKQGDNYYTVDVCYGGWELAAGYYVLEIRSLSDELWYLHFEVPENTCE